MSESTKEPRDYGFAIGLLTGALVGAGLAMCLAPRSTARLHQQVADRARDLGRRASGAIEQAGTGVGAAVSELTRKGRGVRDGVAEAVARVAHKVERHATPITTSSVTDSETPGV